MNKKIFIADDDENILEGYKNIFDLNGKNLFEDEKYYIQTFSDGKYLIDSLKNEYTQNRKIPLCILDKIMPTDGFTTAKKIREIDEKIYIIIVTGYDNINMQELIKDLKNNIYYLKKPIKNEEFLSLIYSLINSWNKNIELENTNSNLESKVAESINKLRERDYVIFQQSRQASMGEMIGNIAHQWRQPLTGLALSIQELKDSFYNKELTDEYLEYLTKESMSKIIYMSDIIDDFRKFFAPNEQKSKFNLKDSIENAILVIKPSFDDSCFEIKLNLIDYLILGYKNEFSQVILNLLKNSLDVSIERKIKLPKIEINLIESSDNIDIEVIDNTGGIDDNIISEIFDPYFTTKYKSQGTGLGLYMSKIIIEKHMSGVLSVKNSKDGAIFQIKFNK